jgi:hypothetical protein
MRDYETQAAVELDQACLMLAGPPRGNVNVKVVPAAGRLSTLT